MRFILPTGQSLTSELLERFLTDHSQIYVTKYNKSLEYYNAKQDILNRTMTDTFKPNNKLVNNYPKYIVNLSAGYFMGVPVTYNTKDEKEEYEKSVQEIITNNNDAEVNFDEVIDMGIYGVGYELLYTDEDAELKYVPSDPRNTFLIQDNTVQKKVKYGVRYWLKDPTLLTTTGYMVDVYDDTNIHSYEWNVNASNLIPISTVAHNLGEVPIIDKPNNRSEKGDFEAAITLIDAYDKLQSDTANDMEYFTNAYLALIGYGEDVFEPVKDDDGNIVGEAPIKTMRDNRILLLDANGKAEWVTKDLKDEAVEKFKYRIQQDIHRFSFVPNLTDEEFAGNLSGVAIKYKLWGLEQLASEKERRFKKSLETRFRIITRYLNIKFNKNYKYTDLIATFNRNVPQNIQELAAIVSMIGDKISIETIHEILPFVTSPATEAARMKKELTDSLSTLMNQQNMNPEGKVVKTPANNEPNII